MSEGILPDELWPTARIGPLHVDFLYLGSDGLKNYLRRGSDNLGVHSSPRIFKLGGRHGFR